MRLAAIAGLGAFTVCVLASTTSAAADRGVASITRRGDARPWIYRGMPAGVTEARTLESRARAVLSALSPESKLLQLTKVDATPFAGGDTIVRFEQVHGGLPVVGRGATVTLDAKGEATLSVVRLEHELPTTTIPRIDASSAARAAQGLTRLRVTESDTALVVWSGVEGATLAWVALPRVPTGFPTAPRIVVDANTGVVIEARDMAVHAKASIYESNPIASPQLRVAELPMSIDGTKLENAFVKTQNCVDRKSVKDVSFVGFAFKVHICDLEQLATPDLNGDFVVTPSDEPGKVESRSDAFSEVSMYYHATRAYAFFRGLQGNAAAQVVDEKPLRTISNLQIADGLGAQDFTKAANPDLPLTPFQNAFYSPSGGGLGQVFEQLYGFSDGAMWFGQGPQRDYSYDGDVVYHELGHAVVNRTLRLGSWHIDKRGAIDSPGAMNEALADYFSSAITGDPKVGEYASKDISVNLDVIRNIDNKDSCPAKVTGEVHLDSTLFSGGLWEARSKVPAADQSKFDAAIYKAMLASPGAGDLGYDDLTLLFVTQLNTSFPAGAKLLEDAMKGRGVLPSCERILEFTGAPVISPTFDRAPIGFASPGKQTLGTSSAEAAPGMIQVHMKLAANTVKAKITFTAKAQGGGGGPFGGGGKPFAPLVYTKFAEAINWTTKGRLTNDAEGKIEPTAAGSTYTAELEVTPGATDLYVQIANKGDSDGTYDSITIVTEATTPTTPPPDGTKPPTGNGSTDDSSGCACTTTGSPGSTGGVALGLGAALLGLAVVRRRR